MRTMLWLLAVSAGVWPGPDAQADDLSGQRESLPAIRITEVLHRSQQVRLDSLAVAAQGTPEAVVVQLSFQRLLRALGLARHIELRVVSGETIAETVHGDIVVANESLAALPEGERLFILAHELGHVVTGHWSEMGALFQKYVPGTVTQAQTDAVAQALGRAASGLVRRHEFDADAFALRTLREMGYADAHAMSALSRFGFHRDTATHPGTRQRVTALCAIDTARVQTAEVDAAP